MVIWFLIGGGLIVLGLMWAAARAMSRQQEAEFRLGMALRDQRTQRIVRKLEKMQAAHDPQLGRYYQQVREPTRKRRLRGR